MHNCRYRGCKREFPTEQGLRMHIGRKHTHTIVNGNGHAQEVKPKRKYVRRPKLNQAAPPKTQYGLNYCNHCGMPLAAVKVALSMT